MFIFKKIFSKFLFPLPLIFCLFLIGLYLLWFTKKQKLGKIFVSLGAFVLLLLSYSFVPDALLVSLENDYNAYPTVSTENIVTPQNIKQPVKYVVVLGAGHTSDPKLPLTSQLSKESLFRLIEGIRIHRVNPTSKLIFTGGGSYNSIATATVMTDLAIELGVNRSEIITETSPKDTKDEARIVKTIVEDSAFILVTSASHMPRSIAIFNKLGMYPTAAPTEHNVKQSQAVGPGLFFPGASNLHKAEKAVYEYLGFIWAKLRGLI